MIRINLLGRPRPKVKRRIAIAGTLQLALFLIPLVAALGFLTWRYFSIQSDLTEIEEEIRRLNAQKSTMAQLEKEIKEFEQKQNALQTRLSVIEQLRRNQQGPAKLLSAIGDTVNQTETLWLTRLDESGTKITLDGVAGSVNAIANFITNLKASGFFNNIEIKEAVQSTQNPGVENYTFSLSCDFVLPKPAESPTATAATTATGGTP